MTAPVPAGWYPDPAPASSGEAMLRWWDGTTWTDHRRPAQDAAPTSSGTSGASHNQAASSGSQQQGTSSGYIAGSEYGGQVGFGSAPPPPEEPAPAQQPAAAQQTATHQSAAGQSSGYSQQPGHYPQQAQGSNQQQEYQQQSQQGGYQQGGGQQHHGGARSPYTENVLAVSQRRKLIEMTNEYDIYGSDGATIGKVTEVGQSGLKKAARFLTSLDQYMTHTLEVRDMSNQLILTLTRPAKIMKSTLVVSHPNGAEMGRLVQRNVFGKIRFGMEAGGQEVGSLNAQNWRAWDFQMLDANGNQVGRITKTWEGMLTTMFTTADKYAVELSPNLTEPLKSLCLAAALCVDTALKQDSRGFG